MAYFIVPEVSGQLGERTILDNSIHPPIVSRLHFIFYGWLGDDLIECFPVFLLTERLKNRLVESHMTGYEITQAEIEMSDEFILLQPNTNLPNFFWLKILGKNGDDFLIFRNKLMVSDAAYSFLREFNMRNATIEYTKVSREK